MLKKSQKKKKREKLLNQRPPKVKKHCLKRQPGRPFAESEEQIAKSTRSKSVSEGLKAKDPNTGTVLAKRHHKTAVQSLETMTGLLRSHRLAALPWLLCTWLAGLRAYATGH